MHLPNNHGTVKEMFSQWEIIILWKETTNSKDKVLVLDNSSTMDNKLILEDQGEAKDGEASNRVDNSRVDNSRAGNKEEDGKVKAMMDGVDGEDKEHREVGDKLNKSD